MVIAVWSVKGGVGVTSVAALLAMASVERAEDVLIVDMCGDVPAVLGVDETLDAPGLVEWCALGRPDGEAMARIEVDARTGLRIVPRGTGELRGNAAELVDVLSTSRRTVIIDCGFVSEADPFRSEVVKKSAVSLLVMRECFLNLRAAQRSAITPTGVVVVKEPRRHLGRADVESVTGVPVVAELAVDHGIARAIDAGLLSARLPRPLLRSMARVVEHAA